MKGRIEELKILKHPNYSVLNGRSGRNKKYIIKMKNGANKVKNKRTKESPTN